MVAAALDDRRDTRVADAEPLAREPADERLPAGGAVEGDVADDDVLLRHEGRLARRRDDDLAAREPLADVVVRVTLEDEGEAPRRERAERLARRAAEVEADGEIGRA